MRQLAPLFGITGSAAWRIIDRLAPHLALAPVRQRHSPDTVLIMDGTLVPTHDRTMTARSKNYRYSANVQVITDADTRLVVATGDPQPGNRNDRTAYTSSGADQATTGARVIADGDGAYRGPNRPGVIIPHRKPTDSGVLPQWKQDHNRSHRRVHARIEHVFARMQNWKILRDCRRRGTGLTHTVQGIALMHNIAAAG